MVGLESLLSFFPFCFHSSSSSVCSAMKVCEDLTCVSVQEQHGKADLTAYRDASCSIMDILGRYCSVLERGSIDEACLDITPQVEQKLGEYIKQISIQQARKGTERNLAAAASEARRTSDDAETEGKLGSSLLLFPSIDRCHLGKGDEDSRGSATTATAGSENEQRKQKEDTSSATSQRTSSSLSNSASVPFLSSSSRVLRSSSVTAMTPTREWFAHCGEVLEAIASSSPSSSSSSSSSSSMSSSFDDSHCEISSSSWPSSSLSSFPPAFSSSTLLSSSVIAFPTASSSHSELLSFGSSSSSSSFSSSSSSSSSIYSVSCHDVDVYDLLLAIGAQHIAFVRSRVIAELGFTCSAGQLSVSPFSVFCFLFPCLF